MKRKKEIYRTLYNALKSKCPHLLCKRIGKAKCLSLCLYKNWSETIAHIHSYFKPILTAHNWSFSYSQERQAFQKKKEIFILWNIMNKLIAWHCAKYWTCTNSHKKDFKMQNKPAQVLLTLIHMFTNKVHVVQRWLIR